MQRAQMLFPTDKSKPHNVLLKNILRTFPTYGEAMAEAKRLHKEMGVNVAYVAHAETQSLVAIVDDGKWIY